MADEQQLATMRDAITRRGNVFDLAEITSFVGYRGPDGQQRRLRIEVYDTGSDGAKDRWNAVVTDRDDGTRVFGSGAPTIDEALAIVPWNELDAPGS